ncbi:hypothetical protein [Spiroplasma alleghenense]|uniref:Cell division protein FtsA n=1 Tax=Spiroplasma alleghenense TaxID=216931 RepID=A0A345Z3W6_9MOLU|nr:hypothetical protein [Spiroplasma alleghenense]AXK51295.1 cell division protein FtsA [Spiroplasma alleghenense]
MRSEIYAALEITKNELRFAVGKYQSNKTLKVLYKFQENGNWLNQENEVIDSKMVSNLLAKAVKEYERNFNKKILKIAVVVPEKDTEIKEAISTLNISNGGPARIVTQQDIIHLNNEAKDVNYSDSRKVVSIKPTRYVIDDTYKKGVAPLGAVAHKIAMYSNVYTIPTKVYNSHLQVVKMAGYDVLNCLIKPYALARQIVNIADLRNKISLVVNWDSEYISLNIFAQETLVRITPINVGLDKMAIEIGNKIFTKPDVVKKYLFKILDFKSNNLSESIIYRKHLTNENKNFELTIGEFKNIFSELISNIMRKLNNIIKHEIIQNTNNDYQIYHTGKITEISGFEELLVSKELIDHQMIYYSDVIGGNDIWTTALCGIMIQEHITNKNSKVITTSTGIEMVEEINPTPSVYNQNPNLGHMAGPQHNHNHQPLLPNHNHTFQHANLNGQFHQPQNFAAISHGHNIRNSKFQ